MIAAPRKLFAFEIVMAGLGLAMPFVFWGVLRFDQHALAAILSVWFSGAIAGMASMTWGYRRGFERTVRKLERERGDGRAVIYEQDSTSIRVDGVPPGGAYVSTPSPPMVAVAIQHVLSADARSAVGELVWQIERLVEADRQQLGQRQLP